MSKLDVDIYMNNIINFFDKNPNDLITLIGSLDKFLFYDKVREQAFDNDKSGEYVELTQKQFVELIAKMHGVEKKTEESEQKVSLFFKTKFGDFCMN
jgi:hypothetical protein